MLPNKNEGLAAMFVGDRMMASTSLAGAAAVFPACTTHCGLRPQCAVNLDRNLKP